MESHPIHLGGAHHLLEGQRPLSKCSFAALGAATAPGANPYMGIAARPASYMRDDLRRGNREVRYGKLNGDATLCARRQSARVKY